MAPPLNAWTWILAPPKIDDIKENEDGFQLELFVKAVLVAVLVASLHRGF